MRHVVFIAFHYPPEASSSGVLRTLKYTRYLQEHGWRVTVISVSTDAYTVTDKALEAQIPESVKVIRTRYLNTKRHLSVAGRYPALLALPDQWIWWIPWALQAGRRLFARDPFEVVYSTFPHPSAHLIGWRLARSTDRPWVADFRDPWCEPLPPRAPDSRLVDRINEFVEQKVHCALERRLVPAASRVVASTAHLCETLRQRYPAKAQDILAILNGYDEADFKSVPETAFVSSDRLLLVHAGSVNGQFRDPRPLFRAIRRCADRGSLDPDRMLVRFIGGGPFCESDEVRQSLAECRIERSVEFRPRVAYDEALAELCRADVLLLLQRSEDTAVLVPAKLYEYLRAQKPVLALVLPGAASDVLGTTGGGWAVDPDRGEDLDGVLATVFSKWQQGTLVGEVARLADLHQYDRRELTAKLAAVLDSVCEPNFPAHER